MGSGGSVNSGKKTENTRNAGKSISSETIMVSYKSHITYKFINLSNISYKKIVENKSVTKEENSPNEDQSKSRGNEDLAEVKPKQGKIVVVEENYRNINIKLLLNA